MVDGRSLLRIQERSKAGRPYSARSAWAVIAVSEDGSDRVGVSGPAVSARVRMQLERLLEPAAEPVAHEEVVRNLVVSLRSVLRNRAGRRLLRAAPADLADLRADERWAMIVDLGSSGIASPDVEGYLAESLVEGILKDYLLVEADRDANGVLHVVSDGQFPVRVTNDADTVIDVRADPTMLATFTGVLTDLGFTTAGITAEGLQHR